MGKFIKFLAFVCLLQLANCWKNHFHRRLYFKCPSNQVITRIASKHSNEKEDRVYDFTCSSPICGLNATLCSWSGYVNNFDQRIDYVCRGGGMISGLFSYFNGYHKDRRWRVRCCRDHGRKPVNCQMSSWLNDWDEPSDYKIHPGYAIQGIFSFHRNDKEDRRWRLMICQV